MNKQDQQLIILVVENSYPVRKLIIENLTKKGIETIEAVDATDALRVMGERTPNSLVLLNLGKTSAIVFAKALGKLKKTYNLAIVLIVSDPETLEEIQKKPLQKSVVPILKYNSMEALTESILTAYKIASANSKSAVMREQDIQSYASSPQAKQQKIKIEKLNYAFGYFMRVIELVRDNKLPGPMIPSMLMKVRKLLNDPDVEYNQIAQFVSSHQTLAAKIVSLANTVYYMRGKRVTNIKQAMVRLGLQEVSKILNALAALEYIAGKNRQLRNLIASSLSKGFLASLIGEFLGRINESNKIDEIYTGGLLHNIGSTFMLYTLSLLHDKGEIDQVDTDALITMVANRADKLNKMVYKALSLPSEISFLYSDASSEHLLITEEFYFLRKYINQAIWVTEQISDNGDGFLTCTKEAELLGFNEEMINRLNEKLPDFLGLLKQYRELGQLNTA